MGLNFRTLKCDEIECRVGTCNQSGYSLLLYKDARCDMAILDETVGGLSWQRSHSVVNNKEFCTVSIRNDDSSGFEPWVGKQDCGTKSNTEAEKGESSDAFKRACVNWGIGRELYSAPFIWSKRKTKPKQNGRFEPVDKVQSYSIQKIEYNYDRKIIDLVIVDENKKIVYSMNENYNILNERQNKNQNKEPAQATVPQIKEIKELASVARTSIEILCKSVKINSIEDINTKQYNYLKQELEKKLNKCIPKDKIDDVKQVILGHGESVGKVLRGYDLASVDEMTNSQYLDLMNRYKKIDAEEIKND